MTNKPMLSVEREVDPNVIAIYETWLIASRMKTVF